MTQTVNDDRGPRVAPTLARRIKRRLAHLRALDWAGRFQYLKLLARGESRDDRAQAARLRALEGGRALFVCHGNILRSALSEVLFRAYAARARLNVSAESAGLFALPGRPADARGRKLAPLFGVSLEEHTSRMITHEMVDDASAVFVMDYLNAASFNARFPQAREKLFLLGSFDEKGQGPTEIPDPYMGDEEAVRQCYVRVDRCIKSVVALLRATEAA